MSERIASPVLEARDLAVTYQINAEQVHAVKSASLRCYAGSVTVLQGASGSGKSSLFSALGGLITPSAGELWVGGRRIDQMHDRQRTELRRRDVALVFQAYNLFPTLTAAGNVAYSLRGLDTRERDHRVAAALERVGMSHRATVRPDRLSGGEQQRVAVARALAQEPQVLLADEPTGALDTGNAENIMEILREYADRREATVFVISHDPMACRFADQRLEIHEGVLAHA